MSQAGRTLWVAAALALAMPLAPLEGAASALPAAEPAGGPLRLQPLIPGGAGRASAGTLELTFTIGQPLTGRSDEDATQLRSGFWTPATGTDGGDIFADGFEEATP